MHPIFWMAVGCAITILVSSALKRPAKPAEIEGVDPVSPQPLTAAIREPSSAFLDQPTAECERVRQKLRIALMYDEDKIDRLVALERNRTPDASEEQLHAAAYEHWLQDNR